MRYHPRWPLDTLILNREQLSPHTKDGQNHAAYFCYNFVTWDSILYSAIASDWMLSLHSRFRLVVGDTDDDIDEFMADYLRLDGVFAMRLILKNTNDAIGEWPLYPSSPRVNR